MKTITIIAWLTASMLATADEKVAVKTISGRFEVTQEFRDSNENQGEWTEIVRFSSLEFPAVHLAGIPWPGIYNISPDEHWLLRTQKTGSGDSIAMLYHIEDNGRVSEVLGFDNLLWNTSDMRSRLKKKELYHTGVTKFIWAVDSGSLEIVLRGSNAEKSADGIEVALVYDFRSNKVSAKNNTSEQAVDGNPH